jgi:hypothetical protein
LSLPPSYTQTAERLRERIGGVEAAMQEAHMQLAQRLSSAVQRVGKHYVFALGGRLLFLC